MLLDPAKGAGGTAAVLPAILPGTEIEDFVSTGLCPREGGGCGLQDENGGPEFDLSFRIIPKMFHVKHFCPKAAQNLTRRHSRGCLASCKIAPEIGLLGGLENAPLDAFLGFLATGNFQRF
jgi:hypothetical protein